MPEITRDTPWRNLGRVPYAIWRKRITDAGGLDRVAAREVWEAAGDDSALMLEFLKRESSYASDFDAIPASWNDPWNLQIAGVGIKFASVVDCVNEWRERLYSGTYKQGIYTKTKTIADLIAVYAPKSDGNDTEAYIAGVVAGINRNGFDPPVQTPSTDPEPIPGEQEQPVSVIFGKVPKPPAINRFISSNQNMAWNDLGTRLAVPNAFVLHRMEGSLNGTDTYFRGFANARQTGIGGLTNIGIGVAAMDGSALAGVTYEWNTPELDTQHRAGWANGQVKGAYGDGLKYVNRFGIDAVNRDTESCEISGQLGTALDEASRAAIAGRLAWRADQYGAVLANKGEQFDYSTFPFIPSQDRNFTIWHQEFTIGTGKTCPGPVVMAETDALIARAKAIMERYQTGAVTLPPEPAPVYAKPSPVAAGSQNLNGYIFLAPGGKTVQADTYPLIYADKNAQPTGPKIKAGTKIEQANIQQYVVGSDGAQWVVLVGVPDVPDFSRFPAAALIKGDAA